MGNNNPFSPVPASTVSLSVTSTSSSSAITSAYQLRLTNLGTNKCYVRTGTSGLTALTTDMPVLASQSVVISINPNHTHVAAVCDATETCTLKVTSGAGE